MGQRLFDASLALLGLLLLLPLLLLLMLWIRHDSPGPALFRQQRVGRHERLFTLYKLRTMHPHTAGAPLCTNHDARISRSGRWLRQRRWDELPQLFNVLRGDMALVGPRPETAELWALYPAKARHALSQVRPGLTSDTALAFSDEQRFYPAGCNPAQVYQQQILPRKIPMMLDERDKSFLQRMATLLRSVAISFPIHRK